MIVVVMTIVIMETAVTDDERSAVRDNTRSIVGIRWGITIVGRVSGIVGRAITASTVIPSQGFASHTQPGEADGCKECER